MQRRPYLLVCNLLPCFLDGMLIEQQEVAGAAGEEAAAYAGCAQRCPVQSIAQASGGLARFVIRFCMRLSTNWRAALRCKVVVCLPSFVMRRKAFLPLFVL